MLLDYLFSERCFIDLISSISVDWLREKEGNEFLKVRTCGFGKFLK